MKLKASPPKRAAWKNPRAAAAIICLAALLSCLGMPAPAAAETLAQIDAEIRTDSTLIRVPGQAAYNVYAGATDDRLDRKITILTAAGVTNFASAGHYGNFYSFTGTAGITDTTVDIVTAPSAMRLYRRGSSSRQEAPTYLGSWWSGGYLGRESTRDGLAVLSSWGSDLNRIYVIDVPAGTTLIGGLAAPMEESGEYRPGGTYQYYYRGAPRGWLVYALYAPDYYKSYATAVTGAQKLGRIGLEDLGAHLDDLRCRTIAGGNAGDDTDIWFRFYGGYSRLTDGGETGQKSRGIHLGWEKSVGGGAPGEQDRWHLGAVLGQGTLQRNEAGSGVKNDITATYGGVYSLYRSQPDRPRSWYGSAAVLYGRLDFTNRVPGELGYGLTQGYSGNLLAASLASGLTFRRPGGWFVEPELALFYTKVMQDAFVDNIGATVTVRRGESLAGRLGLRVLRKIEAGGGRQATLSARASYLRAFRGRNRVDLSGDQGVSEGGRNVCELSLGADLAISKDLSINADIARSFGDEHGYRGSLTLRSYW